ncbi:hypothetical protein [Sphaerotilus hippei]|uniref:hypothetical protein n=1 Tax=Sphaerotilus hippei TaxID=744406 RepID=UPI0011B7C3D6|nr:hypothetical protein [Sphaerotilus hippei]
MTTGINILNPYTDQLAALEAEISIAEARGKEKKRLLDCYNAFDLDENVSDMRASERRIDALHKEHVRIKEALETEVSREKALTIQASISLDPRTWLSSARLKSVDELKICRNTQNELLTRQLNRDHHEAQAA